MTTTRRYYEKLLDIFEQIVSIKSNDFLALNRVRIDLSDVLRRIKIFRIFELNLSEEFDNCFENNNAAEFGAIQSKLGEELYNLLGGLLYTFESTDRKTDYGRALEIYRTELPFQIVRNWYIKTNEDGQFSMGMLFFDMNRKWISIDTEESYLDYKNQIRNKKSPLRYTNDLVKIPDEKYSKLKMYFNEMYDNYQKYVYENYPTICQEFSLYNSNVNIYIIDRNGQPGETTMQLNAYKSTDGKASINVAPYFYDFISRFSNLEEIEHPTVSCSLSLFKVDNPEEYNFQFDISSIYHELSQIFIRNSNEYNLRLFLIFLLRSELKRVQEVDETRDELIINHKKFCKHFLKGVPNIYQIKKELEIREDSSKYSFAVFTSSPDEETISLLESLRIEPIYLDRLARNHINNQNGEIIHWYIKSQLNNLEIITNNGLENQAEQLIQKLENCPTGLKGWIDYENICTDIFKYLFQNDFRNYVHKTQSYTHDNIFRRDIIIHNNFSDPTSVWGQAKNDYNCNVIVIDFKNYENPLEQNEFYLPSKYLNLVSGNFGIVISRKGLGNSAKILQKRMLNSENRLLLSLEDKDLIGMLRDKSLNQNPSYRLENLKFSLYEEI